MEQALRLLCIVLAGLLAWEASRAVLRYNPVARLAVPAVPTLTDNTNTIAKNKTPGLGNVQTIAGKQTTNFTAAGKSGTNAAASNESETIATASTMTTTNRAASNIVGAGSNAMAQTGIRATNGAAGKTETNAGKAGDTNAPASQASAKPAKPPPPEFLAMAMAGAPFGPGGMGGQGPPKLKPLIQARLDKIVESGILATLIHPQPTALIGIAGNGAMLRSASGQSGFVKEGGELGGLKLLEVGINRVLVEENGKKKELTVFEGIGGESLLPKAGQTNDGKARK